jgi:hypothetical protein
MVEEYKLDDSSEQYIEPDGTSDDRVYEPRYHLTA